MKRTLIGTTAALALGASGLLFPGIATTGGDVQRESMATASLAGVGRADGLATTEWAHQTASKAEAWEQANIQKIRFADGKLLIRSV